MNSRKELILSSGPQPRTFPLAMGEKELTIKDLWGVFKRRKSTVFVTMAFCLAVAIMLCIFSTRRYAGVGELQVEKGSVGSLGLETMMGSSEGGADAIDENITMQTESRVLQSDSLALKVIKDLKLDQNEDFRPKFSPIGWALGLFSPPGHADPKGVSLEDSPGRRTQLLRAFASHLKVKPLAGTRLIDVTFVNPDPKVAAAVVNHLIDGLADFNFQTRFNATQQAAGWLGGQLSDLRKQSEDLQAKVVQLQRDSGVFTLGESDSQGRQQVYTPVLDRLEQATTRLTQAQSNRIMKGALYEIVRTGDPELISGLAGTAMAGSGPSSAGNSLSLIQNLRAQEASMQGQLNELSAKFGPAYPKLTEVRANLQGIQNSIHAEIGRVAQRAKNDFAMSQRVEDNERGVFDREKHEADALNDKTVEYTIARQEADQSRTLYENLLGKLNEAGVLAGLRSSNISIVDPARVPASPAKPNVLLYLAASLAGGLLLGSSAALLRDAMDNKIENLTELETYWGAPLLGILPYHRNRRGLLQAGMQAIGARGDSSPALIDQPHSAYTESVRHLRTSVLQSNGQDPPQVILVTSSVPGEGKSMLSVNLAALLARQNQDKKVLLVDGDLREPVLNRSLNVAAGQGLSSILASRYIEEIEEKVRSTPIPMDSIPGLDLLPAGPVPRYPAELLGSRQMREAMRIWREQYSFIIIDGAPLLPVTDSVVLSGLTDLTLVVARYKMTERQSLDRSCRLLQASGGQHRFGIVLNAVERSADTYFQYYGYRHSNYYGDQQHA
jgi:capsular exopolysaccharide synthesis family protein